MLQVPAAATVATAQATGPRTAESPCLPPRTGAASIIQAVPQLLDPGQEVLPTEAQTVCLRPRLEVHTGCLLHGLPLNFFQDCVDIKLHTCDVEFTTALLVTNRQPSAEVKAKRPAASWPGSADQWSMQERLLEFFSNAVTILSVLEYASAEWVALPAYLSDLLEQVQRKALYIVFPDRCYSDALHVADLELLSDRRQQACMNFATSCDVSGTLSSLFRIPKGSKT
ncbi:hypothetical protein P5673_032623 [Acropora cervicornis]|uniref:Uncharacterized protein n=1 Tax=Acropora cervicornis TaxID=6130 RepID=A0AAD9PR94_ACRCE|nr:hypothetical protein P5673_032623 [Acropora cervicornis]